MNARLEAWTAWQHAAGAWQGWIQCPPLLSPSADAVETSRPRASRRALALTRQLASTLEPGGVLCVLDLEPTLGVHVAAELSARRLAHPVLVLPRWPYRESILPSARLVEALISEAGRLEGGERLQNVVFVLDAQRGQLVPNRPVSDPRADNRHTLSIFDLPNLATLRARGIQRIVRVLHGPA